MHEKVIKKSESLLFFHPYIWMRVEANKKNIISKYSHVASKVLSLYDNILQICFTREN